MRSISSQISAEVSTPSRKLSEGPDWLMGVASVIVLGYCTNRTPVVIRGPGLYERVGAVIREPWPRSVVMLGTLGALGTIGTMMYSEEKDIEDMRVPPIQLEHLPEVFLCT